MFYNLEKSLPFFTLTFSNTNSPQYKPNDLPWKSHFEDLLGVHLIADGAHTMSNSRPLKNVISAGKHLLKRKLKHSSGIKGITRCSAHQKLLQGKREKSTSSPSIARVWI